MANSIIGALLAATAIVPTIASAQLPNVDARVGVQVDAQRDGDQARREEYRAQRQQQRGPGGQQGQPAVQGQAQAQAQAQAQGGAQYRQDQAQQRPQQQGQDQRGQDQRGQYRQDQNRPDQYRQAQDQRGQYRQGQNDQRDDRQGQRPNFGPNAPGGQGGYAGRGNDARGYDNRGGQQDGRGYRNNRGGWNNGWHGDRRYDWNSYRAQNRGAFRLPRYYAPGGGYGYRRYSVGITLGYGFYGQNYWIGNPYDYRLPPAYGPYRWVRYYNDALLVDVRSGYVVDAVYGIFW